jgi:hypothetical protein
MMTFFFMIFFGFYSFCAVFWASRSYFFIPLLNSWSWLSFEGVKNRWTHDFSGESWRTKVWALDFLTTDD